MVLPTAETTVGSAVLAMVIDGDCRGTVTESSGDVTPSAVALAMLVTELAGHIAGLHRVVGGAGDALAGIQEVVEVADRGDGGEVSSADLSSATVIGPSSGVTPLFVTM